MFTELKNAIDASDWILNNLKWSYDNLISEIESCKNEVENSGDKYYAELLQEDKVKLEAYEAVKLALQKFVKSKV